MEKEQQSLIDLLKPAEVAARLGVSRTWLYDAARDGRIPSIRIGGREGTLRFVPEDLTQWLDEARAQWTPGQRRAVRLVIQYYPRWLPSLGARVGTPGDKAFSSPAPSLLR